MTSRRSILLGLALAAFLGAFGLNSVYAQVPRSISYQGQLVKNGQPVTGSVDLKITIYDAASTVLYQESANAVSVTNGVFNVLLGGNAPGGGLSANLKFDEQYYLGINVNNTGEVTPRTPFAAAPYALNSQTVGGVGVSLTPQPGMLLPLDATGKLPKSVLPQSTQALTTINSLAGDAGGNVTIAPGAGITVTNTAPGTITIAATGGSGSAITAIQAGPGLIGGGNSGIVTLAIAPFGITPGMLGFQSVSGHNLDQNIPQWGLWQDQQGQLNVGIDQTMVFAPAVANNQVLGMPTRTAPSMNGIGLNLAHTNTWTVVQNFAGGLTGTLGTITTAVIGTPGVNSQALTVNGLAEPLAGPNGAVFYEIQDNGDLRVTGSTTTTGNTFIGITNANAASANTVGTPSWSVNNVAGITNGVAATNTAQTAVNASNSISAQTIGTGTASNSVTATNSGSGVASNTISAAGGLTINSNSITASGAATSFNTIDAPVNRIGTSQTGGNSNQIGTATFSVNTVTGSTNTVTGSTSNSIQSPTNTIGTTQVAGNTNTVGTTAISANTVTGLTNAVTASTTNTMTAGTTNTLTATTSNNAQAPTNNIGTVAGNVANNIGTAQVAGGTNTIGTANFSTNTANGLSNNLNATTTPGGTAPTNTITATGNGTNATNTMTATGNASASNNLVAQTNNIGAGQTAGGANNMGTGATGANTDNIGTAGVTTNNINGLVNNSQAQTINSGTGQTAGGTINIGSTGSTTNSTITFWGPTTFNGAHTVNGASIFAGNITQTAPGTTATFLATNTGNLTITGFINQSGGLATLAGAAGANSFGSAAGANNTIGNAASSANTLQGTTNQIGNTPNGTTSNTMTAITNNIVGTGALGKNQIDAQVNSIGTSQNGTTNASNTIGTGSTATSGVSTNTLNGVSNVLNAISSPAAIGQNLLLATNGGGGNLAGATNKFDATGGAQNWSTGNFRQTGNAYFTGGGAASGGAPGSTTTFDQETVSGLSTAGSNSTIVRFSTIQADNNLQIGAPPVASQTIIQVASNGPNFADNATAPTVVQLSTASGVIPTIQLVDVPLVNGVATLTSGVSNTGTYGNPANLGVNRTLYFDVNSAAGATYTTNATPQGAITILISGATMTITSSTVLDNNTVRIRIFRQ